MRILGVLILTAITMGCGTVEGKKDSGKENPTEEENKGELIYPVVDENRDMPFNMIIANQNLPAGDYLIADGELVSEKIADTYCTFSVFNDVEKGEVSEVYAIHFAENESGRVEVKFRNSTKTYQTFGFGECILAGRDEFRVGDFSSVLGTYFSLD